MTNKFLYLLAVVFCLSLPLQADVYRYIDKDGTVIFTDAPPKGSESKKITIGKPTTEPAFSTPLKATTPTATQSNQNRTSNLSNTIYTISVSSPEHGTTINAPGGSLNVVVSVEPAPEADFTIRVLVDGNEAANSNTPIVAVDGLNRGSHSFNAQLLAIDGSILATSNTNVIKILRPSKFIQERLKKNQGE